MMFKLYMKIGKRNPELEKLIKNLKENGFEKYVENFSEDMLENQISDYLEAVRLLCEYIKKIGGMEKTPELVKCFSFLEKKNLVDEFSTEQITEKLEGELVDIGKNTLQIGEMKNDISACFYMTNKCLEKNEYEYQYKWIVACKELVKKAKKAYVPFDKVKIQIEYKKIYIKVLKLVVFEINSSYPDMEMVDLAQYLLSWSDFSGRRNAMYYELAEQNKFLYKCKEILETCFINRTLKIIIFETVGEDIQELINKKEEEKFKKHLESFHKKIEQMEILDYTKALKMISEDEVLKERLNTPKNFSFSETKNAVEPFFTTELKRKINGNSLVSSKVGIKIVPHDNKYYISYINLCIIHREYVNLLNYIKDWIEFGKNQKEKDISKFIESNAEEEYIEIFKKLIDRLIFEIKMHNRNSSTEVIAKVLKKSLYSVQAREMNELYIFLAEKKSYLLKSFISLEEAIGKETAKSIALEQLSK